MRRLILLTFLVSLTGCVLSGKPPAPSGPSVELVDVPFFAQGQYQCGPAALATVLATTGVATEPDVLARYMYLPDRQGSLQAELVSTTRQQGRIALPLAPSAEAILTELHAGNPVLLLQNLGVKAIPRWHYAVVVGYDAETGRWILRSGKERRRLERHSSFLRRWELAGFWGLVVTRPGVLPASISARQLLEALAQSEARLAPDAALATWEAARQRWQDNPAILFASANAARAAGAEREAGRLYRQLLLHEPEFYAARNNYADLLLHAGCRDQAQRVFEPLREVLSDLPGSLGDAVRDTEKAIREAASTKACSMPEAAGDDRRPEGGVIPAEEAMSPKSEAYSA